MTPDRADAALSVSSATGTGRVRRRPIGSLTHADFGRIVTVPGYGPGVLWSVQHCAANDDEPWTRVIVRPTRGGGSEGTKGLPPTTVITVEETTDA